MQPTELLKQGQLLRRQDRAEAIACFEESIQRAESTNDQIAICYAVSALAVELIGMGQIAALGRAKSLLERSHYLLTTLDDKAVGNFRQQQQNYLIYAQALLDYQEGNFKQSIAQLLAIRNYFHQHPEMPANIEQNLAEAYIAIGDFHHALIYLECPIRAASYEQLGRIYLQLDQNTRAKSYFERGLDIAIDNDDKYLRVQFFIGLSKVAIAEEQWESAINVISEVLLELEEPIDIQQMALLHLTLAEAKLAIGEIITAQEYIQIEAIPRFSKLQNQHGLATAKLTLAKILYCRLVQGIDSMTEEIIDEIVDEFLEALILFEVYGTPQEKAKTLYNLANLYVVCGESFNRYQFCGKALRSLEQALAVLGDSKKDSPVLVGKIESLLDELMQNLRFV